MNGANGYWYGESAPITSTVTETDKRTLTKVRNKETEYTKKGWRYVRISNTTQVFVPCDEEGKPTLKGEETIKRYKEYLGANIKNI